MTRNVLLIAVLLSEMLAFSDALSRADLLGPRPTPKPDEVEPRPVTFKIVNRGKRPLYLQGVRQDRDHLVLTLFHQEGGGGWKPFIDYLPCDLPQCHEMGQPRKRCPNEISVPIPLGPAGGSDAVFESLWEGRLYERREAMVEKKRGQYCYRSSVPTEGMLRVKVEYSETLSEDPRGGIGRIGPREKSIVEFPLPPKDPIVEIPLDPPRPF
jgi:hypothetical protein